MIGDNLTNDEAAVDAFHRASFLELKKQGIRQFIEQGLADVELELPLIRRRR